MPRVAMDVRELEPKRKPDRRIVPIEHMQALSRAMRVWDGRDERALQIIVEKLHEEVCKDE